jgi:hypothetical protein
MSIKLKSSLLAGVCTLLMAINTVDMGGLKDITKPYLGEYRCESALYGKTDCLQYFSFIKFELKTGEEYLLTFKFKDGKQQQKTGKYEYDKEKKTIKILTPAGNEWHREFPVENGKIIFAFPFGDKCLKLTFLQGG